MSARISRKRLIIQRGVAVLGICMSGKTALCVRFVKNEFNEHYMPTLENNFSKNIRHKGQETEMSIKDTQGLQNDEIFRNEYGLGYHGYVLVYAIDDRRSFETLKAINLKLLNLVHQKVPRILVGNKSDLPGRLRQVTTNEGEALAAKWGCPFFETSAKNTMNIDPVFHSLLDEIEKASEPETSLYGDFTSQCVDLVCCRMEDNPLVSDSTKFESVLKWLIAVTLVLGTSLALAGVLLDIFKGRQEHEAAFLAWVLCGFGVVKISVSFFGIYGIRQANDDLLRLYWVALLIILFTELAAWLILFRNLSLMSSHSFLSALALCISFTIKLVSIVAVCCYQRAQPQLEHSPLPSYSHDW